MEKDYTSLIVTHSGATIRITINRPKQLNALSSTVLQELHTVLTSEVTPETRAIVVEGAGDRAFVAGADIEEMSSLSPLEAREFSRLGHTVMGLLESLPLVTVAKVHGYALGGGAELAMACDIVICDHSAKFGQPEVNLGLIPGFGGTQRLVRRVGHHQALDMLLCGKSRTVGGVEAHQIGLASRVVEDSQLEAEVQKVLAAVISAGPDAVQETKRLVRAALDTPLAAGLNAESLAFANCFASDEGIEGMTAFVEKRPPEFAQQKNI